MRSFVFFMAEGIHGILRSQCLHGADGAGGKRIARSLNMTDLSGNALKTFSDYSEEPDLQFSLVELMPGSSWHGKSLAELRLPSGMATALILRGKEKPIPHGETILQELNRLVMTSQPWHSAKKLLDSETLEPDDDRIGQSLATIRSRSLVCIVRDRGMIMPEGSTILQAQDTLVSVDSGSLR